MALVDVLDYFPANHAGRKELIAILDRFAAAVAKVQDPATGLWYDIVDRKDQQPNYPESSGSSMLTYTLAKASRLGYVTEKYHAVAERGYAGIKERFIVDSAGGIHLRNSYRIWAWRESIPRWKLCLLYV